MKKLALAVIATAFIGISGAPAFAQTPAPDPTVLPGVTLPLPLECSERDGGSAIDAEGRPISDACVDFYIAVGASPPVIEQVPPVVTTTTTIVLNTGALPRTGSSISPLLGMGALLLVGGGIIVVGTRRRSTATAS